MDIIFDPDKRAATLERRGLDFADAGQVFAGETSTRLDTREDYGEERFQTAGFLAGRCVVMVWTPRGSSCRVISMRHAHDDERGRWFP